MFCLRCNAVECVMARITAKWTPGEMPQVRDFIEDGIIKDLVNEATEREAWILRSVILTIPPMAKAASITPESLRDGVVSAINRHLERAKEIEDYDTKNGEGSYSRKCQELVASWAAQAYESAAGR